MGSVDAFEEPGDTHEEVMAATYRALCAHGYAGLTIQRIADEFPKSKALLYHHYESKDDLLLEFLSFMLERFESSVPDEEYDDAGDQLSALVEHVFPDDPDGERREFASAMVELQAQAASDPAYREHFTHSSRFFHDRAVEIVERGIEEGVFREVDPDRVATFLTTAIDGSRFRRATADVEETIPALRAEIEAYLDARVFAEAGEGFGGNNASGDVTGDGADEDGAGSDGGEEPTEEEGSA